VGLGIAHAFGFWCLACHNPSSSASSQRESLYPHDGVNTMNRLDELMQLLHTFSMGMRLCCIAMSEDRIYSVRSNVVGPDLRHACPVRP
jgi:hypothetical protein